MRIFRILTSQSAQEVRLCAESDQKLFSEGFNCTPIKIGPDEIRVYIRDRLRLQRNFFYFHPAAIVFDRKAYESNIGGFLHGAGEIFELRLDKTKEILFLLNVLTCYNALDEESSEFDFLRNPIPGQPSIRGGIRKYAIHPERLEEAVPFKIPESRRTDILCDSGRVSQEDEFYYAYQKSGLTGLYFVEIWQNSG